MSGFIEGENRYQSTLFPERVDEYVEENSVVRVVNGNLNLTPFWDKSAI
jgi:hypothetical protein